MHSVSETGNDNANKYFINIDFGAVPVGSVRKRSIDITNDLKASSYYFLQFFLKSSMYYVYNILLYTTIFVSTIYSMVLQNIFLNSKLDKI